MLFPTEQLLKMSVMDQNMHKFSCPGFESLMRRDLFMTAWFRSQPSFLSGENWICWYWLHWIACAIRSRKCMPNTMPSVYYSGKEIGSFLKCVTYQTYNSIITLSLNTLYRPYFFIHTNKPFCALCICQNIWGLFYELCGCMYNEPISPCIVCNFNNIRCADCNWHCLIVELVTSF